MKLYILNQLIYLFRIVLAGACGICIGYERKNRFKEAGIRTHFVVAFASALMMIISKYSFGDMAIGSDGFRGADGARIAAQVVSGVGFLGAGMIFVHKNTVTGLTTAAGIWATSGIGLAIGAGMYCVGIASSILLVLAQIFLHKNFHWLKSSKSKKFVIKDVTSSGFQDYICGSLESLGVSIYDVYIEKNENSCDYTFIIEVPSTVREEEIVFITDNKCKLSANA